MSRRDRSTDRQGRSYALISETKPGDWLEPDADFSCMKAGRARQVRLLRHDAVYSGLWIRCSCGRHHLDGQRKGNYYLGLYPSTKPKP